MSNPNHTHTFYGVECTLYEYQELTNRFPPGTVVSKREVEAVLARVRPFIKTTEEETKTPEPQVADSVAATLAQRGSRYGDFTDHARICQALKRVMENTGSTAPSSNPGQIRTAYTSGWPVLSDVQKQALEVIADKIARILSGDPNYDDNWHDIQGYAKLVEDRLPKKE